MLNENFLRGVQGAHNGSAGRGLLGWERMDPGQDSTLRRRAQGRGTAQVRDEGKFRPPDSQDLNAGREREEGAKHRLTSSKPVLVGGGAEKSIEAMEEASRKFETKATGLARGEPGQNSKNVRIPPGFCQG